MDALGSGAVALLLPARRVGQTLDHMARNLLRLRAGRFIPCPLLCKCAAATTAIEPPQHASSPDHTYVAVWPHPAVLCALLLGTSWHVQRACSAAPAPQWRAVTRAGVVSGHRFVRDSLMFATR